MIVTRYLSYLYILMVVDIAIVLEVAEVVATSLCKVELIIDLILIYQRSYREIQFIYDLPSDRRKRYLLNCYSTVAKDWMKFKTS